MTKKTHQAKVNNAESSITFYGSETEKALKNFALSQLTLPRPFIAALGLLKSACAQANQQLVLLNADKAQAIVLAANEIADGLHYQQFPVDVFQTGSGTSTNMNANEVIANLVKLNSHNKINVHANDDVNLGQSSNDVIPSCIHISAAILIKQKLLPALSHLAKAINKQAIKHKNVIKTGRTHLMDAMPLSVGQEFSAWREQINFIEQRLHNNFVELTKLAIGGTAVGTGVNTHQKFALNVSKILAKKTKIKFTPADNYFRALSAQDTAVLISGILKTGAVSLSKISNDIRWLSSGPLNGLNEMTLAELQKGSSIMPGKVNPVIPEAVLMACTQIIANDTTITLAGQVGNFQLNTMLPLIAYSLIQSIELLSNASLALADKVIDGMQINEKTIAQNLAKNPILATALAPVIGYDKSAEIAKKAYQENRSVLDVAMELTKLSEDELLNLLDPKKMIKPNS